MILKTIRSYCQHVKPVEAIVISAAVPSVFSCIHQCPQLSPTSTEVVAIVML